MEATNTCEYFDIYQIPLLPIQCPGLNKKYSAEKIG